MSASVLDTRAPRQVETCEVDLSRAFAGLVNALRREILELMIETHESRPEGTPISEIAATLGLGRLTASHHLAYLRDAGLVTEVTVGRARLQRLDLRTFEALGRWLEPFVMRS